MGTERKRAFIINVIYYAIMVVAAFAVIKWGLPMLAPFVVGFVIAYLLRWPTDCVSKKTGWKKKPVALLMVLVFYSTAGLLIAFLSIRAYSGIRDLIMYLPQFYTGRVAPVISELFVRFENLVYRMDTSLFALIQGYDEQLIQWLGSWISSFSGRAVGLASNLAASIPGLFIKIVLMIISTFFIAADYDILMGFCIRQMGEKSAALFHQIRRYLVGTLFVCIGSYAIIASLTFVELSIGLSILDIDHAVLIAFLIAIFDILPVVGTGGIMVPWAVVNLLRGNVPLGLELLLLYVAITVIRNVVEPKIVGGQLGLHPVVTLASMFAGVQMFGVVGLFGFPIGLSLIRYLDDNGSIHVFKSEQEEE